MAFYGKEKQKFGALTGTIISFPREIPDNNPSSLNDATYLPSGYLRCDGSIYNDTDYPELAAIIGTGADCKFLRTDNEGTPLITLKSNQFVVPDLGSKFPKPTTSNIGIYDNIVLRNSANTANIYRSGIGISASSTVGTSVTVDYTGKFNVPAQTIPLRGDPGWTIASSVDNETVQSAAIAPHAHFSTTNRCRIQPININPDGSEPPYGRNFYLTASTIPISAWGDSTSYGGVAFKNQPACWAIAASDFRVGEGTCDGSILRTCYWNYNTTGSDVFKPYCLTTTALSYNRGAGFDSFGGTQYQNYETIVGSTIFGLLSGGNVGGAGSTPATYTSNSAPSDWLTRTLVDVLPIDKDVRPGTTPQYCGVNNITTTTTDLYTSTTNDLTNHTHTINKDPGTHNYTIQTRPFLISPSGINTTVYITPDTAVSLNTATSPFIVVDYLIKT
jgi:hypothetical protein